MITITTQRGVIEIPCPRPNDAETIMGNCEHGVSLFDTCFDCIWLENYRRFAAAVKPLCRVPNCQDPSCRLEHDEPETDREEPAGYHAECGPECGYIQKLRGL